MSNISEKLTVAKSFVIDRRRWYRGKDESRLLQEKGCQMCCLGFYSRACGIKPKDIRGKSVPGNLSEELLRFMGVAGLFNYRGPDRFSDHTKIARELMVANDYQEIKPCLRESKIRNLFKELGVRVKFVN